MEKIRDEYNKRYTETEKERVRVTSVYAIDGSQWQWKETMLYDYDTSGTERLERQIV